jgi:hypothetical protein
MFVLSTDLQRVKRMTDIAFNHSSVGSPKENVRFVFRRSWTACKQARDLGFPLQQKTHDGQNGRRGISSLDVAHRVHELLCVSTVTNAHHDVSRGYTS